MDIRILMNHNSRMVIGKIDGNILTMKKDAKITDNMLFDAFNGGLKILEDEWVEDLSNKNQPHPGFKRYIYKAEIIELSI